MSGQNNGDIVARVLREKANAARIQADLHYEEFLRLNEEAEALMTAYEQRTGDHTAKNT